MSKLLVLRILKSLNERELWSAHSSGSPVLYTRESRGKFWSPFPQFFLSSKLLYLRTCKDDPRAALGGEGEGWMDRWGQKL